MVYWRGRTEHRVINGDDQLRRTCVRRERSTDLFQHHPVVYAAGFLRVQVGPRRLGEVTAFHLGHVATREWCRNVRDLVLGQA